MDFGKVTTDETPAMIVLGVIVLYLLIVGFIIYLFLLHRISIVPTAISAIIFTIIYIPRFNILKKIYKKDDMKILDEGILINGNYIRFQQIKNFKTIERKPVIVFFFNSKMIVFKESIVHLQTELGDISFNVIGTTKIHLLNDFLKITLKT